MGKSSSDADSDFKTRKATSGTPSSTTATPSTAASSGRESNFKPATPIVAAAATSMGHGGNSGSGDLNPRPSTSVVKIALKRKTQTTLDSSLEKLQKPKKP